jgi:hypothetical protein
VSCNSNEDADVYGVIANSTTNGGVAAAPLEEVVMRRPRNGSDAGASVHVSGGEDAGGVGGSSGTGSVGAGAVVDLQTQMVGQPPDGGDGDARDSICSLGGFDGDGVGLHSSTIAASATVGAGSRDSMADLGGFGGLSDGELSDDSQLSV